MKKRLVEFLSKTFNVSEERIEIYIRRFWVALAATMSVLFATLIVAFDDIFVSFDAINTLEVGEVAPRTIAAPATSRPFESAILTEEARQQASDSVPVLFDPPDPNVARQQTQLTQQIIDFINNVRADVYATIDQKSEDINNITALTLDERIVTSLLRLNDETWTDVANEILSVLPRVMRETIQPNQLETVKGQLTIQVSVRFNPQERDIIVSFLEDLIRPNTFENLEATEAARQMAAEAVEPIQRTFVRGETIVNEGEIVTVADYEAIQALGLLRSEDRQLSAIGRAFVSSVIVLVLVGLYSLRFVPNFVLNDTFMLALTAIVFLIALMGARFFGIYGNLYIYPAAAMAMILTTIVGSPIAVITSLGLAFLTGIMAGNSLEVAVLFAAGSITAILGLRRVDRLNTFFVAGFLTGVINAAVVGVFILAAPNPPENIQAVGQIVLAFINGALIAPTTSFAILYVLTQLFNLPTVVKLLDLAQPSKPLLQRLLREAPGTYQHSLQVANLAEQAAHAIGADAQMTHVAALYHDIGKMNNPLYFTENQQDIGNPHDALNDPYRSADIIIGHITEGDEMARQYRLPNRLRDFIREHHGTTQVFVFYQQALQRADGDANSIDIADFTYPGPMPQSRETAILMLADSCEAAVRSVKPNSKSEITELITKIFNQKRDHGQLDASGLTLRDLQIIRQTFIDILLGMFHPRINYQEAVNPNRAKNTPAKSTTTTKQVTGTHSAVKTSEGTTSSKTSPKPPVSDDTSHTKSVHPAEKTQEITKDSANGQKHSLSQNGSQTGEKNTVMDDDDLPMSEVPRLTQPDDKKRTEKKNTDAGQDNEVSNQPDDSNTQEPSS
jgi:putative nucleotidyltransferase with HDIG domain